MGLTSGGSGVSEIDNLKFEQSRERFTVELGWQIERAKIQFKAKYCINEFPIKSNKGKEKS